MPSLQVQMSLGNKNDYLDHFRYQKCLRQGMLKEGVRLDRVRGGRQKYRRYLYILCNSFIICPVELLSPFIGIIHDYRFSKMYFPRYSVETSATHGSHPGPQARRPVSLEDNKLLVSLASCEPEPLLACLDPPPGSPHIPPVALLADLYDRELVSTIGWAKQVPGFTDLTLNDQMRLLQTTWTEVCTLVLNINLHIHPPILIRF